ncbi:hypothetical protein Ahy_A06g027522 [Arachis hypogaea]|uniref:Ammonium transporter AmtB-like domain-containing protein n=1 Tax=Arachis hypogaea TaxID=3818 RepID=A0A445CNW6_ARAHY|nr:hypothetical protein Ahy_A06g027522 [Arachis hypogaea]
MDCFCSYKEKEKKMGKGKKKSFPQSTSASSSAITFVGPRSEKEREAFASNNMIVALGGAGLVWMGWSGFNGGAPLAVNTLASLAILNTHVCAATSIVTWLVLDSLCFGKPTMFGAIQGLITGLVCITPAAGVVQGWTAILMGLFSGSVPWYTLMVLHKKLKFLNKIDDPMAIFHTHAITGILGGILTGLFAVPKLCRLFYGVPDWKKYTGLFYGLKNGLAHAGLTQLGIQLEATIFVVVFNVISTTVICLVVRSIVPLRVDDEDALQVGGDKSMHGEEAFALWCSHQDKDTKFENVKQNKVYDTKDFSSSIDESSTKKASSEVQMGPVIFVIGSHQLAINDDLMGYSPNLDISLREEVRRIEKGAYLDEKVGGRIRRDIKWRKRKEVQEGLRLGQRNHKRQCHTTRFSSWRHPPPLTDAALRSTMCGQHLTSVTRFRTPQSFFPISVVTAALLRVNTIYAAASPCHPVARNKEVLFLIKSALLLLHVGDGGVLEASLPCIVAIRRPLPQSRNIA